MEELSFIHGLEQVEKSTDIVAVGGKVVGTGEIDDLAAVAKSTQTPPGVDPAQFWHQDIQYIEVKASCLLCPRQRYAAIPESLHLSTQIRAGAKMGIQHCC